MSTTFLPLRVPVLHVLERSRMQHFEICSRTNVTTRTLLQGDVGYNQQTSRLITAISSTVYVFCSFACLLMIDRFGRRK